MFVDLVYVCMQPHLVADATKMFQSLDVNRDGRLEPEELDQAIASFRKLSTVH
jgi:Ca2+-binding EF-hand superfamily protein